MTSCPYCLQEIQVGTVQCPHCGAATNQQPGFGEGQPQGNPYAGENAYQSPQHQSQPPKPGGGADPLLKMIVPVGRSGLSILAGYLGLFSLICGLLAPFAVIFGIWAVIDLRKRPGVSGMGRAIFGIVAGTLLSIVYLFVILASLVMG